MGFIVIIPIGISTLHLYLLSHRFYCHYSDRNLYTTSLTLISSVLLSLFRQGSLHYISTSYFIGFIITYHIISHPSCHLPILRVLSYTNFSHRCYHLVSHDLPNPNYIYSSIIIIKCRITWLSGGNHSSSPLVFSGVRVAQSLVFYVVFCRSLFVRLSFFSCKSLYLLSVPIQFATSDYSFCIFKF